MRCGRFTGFLGWLLAATALSAASVRPGIAFDERTAPRPAAAAAAEAAAAAADSSRVPVLRAPPGAVAPVRPKKPIAYTDLWRFGRNQRVHEDEVVRGQVVVVGGDLRVDGEVSGGAVVIGGNIDVGPKGRIDGQTVAVAGRVTAAPGASVHGALSLSTFSTPAFRMFGGAHAQQAGELAGDLLKLAVLLLLSRLLARLLGSHLEQARGEFAAGRLRCVGLGLFALPAGIFTAIVVAFLLALSLVGMPVAVLLLAAMMVIALVSLFVGASWLGSWAASRSRIAAAPAWRTLALGLVLMRLPELIADVLRVLAPESRLAFGFEIADVVLELAVLAGGLGALVLARWGPAANPPEPSWAGAG